jgi:hypothetical protein
LKAFFTACYAFSTLVNVDMSYSDFTIYDLKAKFPLSLRTTHTLFSGVPLRQATSLYKCSNTVLVWHKTIGAEKARSEFIIAPILMEARFQASSEVSLFSGTEFTVLSPQYPHGGFLYLKAQQYW